MIQEKILVVEDDIQIQNFMVFTLENAGFEVVAVPDGKEAIECMIRKRTCFNYCSGSLWIFGSRRKNSKRRIASFNIQCIFCIIANGICNRQFQ